VTSSAKTCAPALAKAVRVSVLRAVAITLCPLLSNSRAKASPKPEEQPVTSQTFDDILNVFGRNLVRPMER
jgi:hypothetical protein